MRDNDECKPIVLLNNFCNFRCEHCYVKKEHKELSIENFKKFYYSLIEPNNCSFLRIAGGEPFLYSHFHEFCMFLSEVNNPDLQVNFTTNVSELNDCIIDDLKMINPNLIKVSLMSMREPEYSKIMGTSFTLTQAKKNIQRLLSEGFSVGINMTIMKKTICDVSALIEYCLDTGINDLFFSQLTPAGSGFDIADQRLSRQEINDIKKIIDLVDPRKLNIRYDDACGCAFNQDFVLNWDGDIFPCSALVSYPEYAIGKVGDTVDDMRFNIKKLSDRRSKPCFVEEFVDY